MKRVGGRVTWLCRLDGVLAEKVREGTKRMTICRGGLVEPGDVLRLTVGDDTIQQVTVVEARDLWMMAQVNGECVGVVARICGNGIGAGELGELARMNGFGSAPEMVRFLDGKGCFLHGIFDGQIIGW
ncbi:MAG: hypothetical protein FWH21_00200 [Kiritimatiellaeota bacterium]|nr:hypothetical protein [Kiritimatiellota bacterium]